MHYYSHIIIFIAGFWFGIFFLLGWQHNRARVKQLKIRK